MAPSDDETDLPEDSLASLGPWRATQHLYTGAISEWSGSSVLRHSVERWWGLGLVLSVAAGATAGALGHQVARGVLLAMVWWLAVTVCLFLGTAVLRSYPGRRRLVRFGVPNGLTAVRAYLSLPVLLYAVMPPRWLGRDLFLAIGSPIAALDAADGYIARRLGPVSVLGRALDPIMDTVFFIVCAAACLWVGFIPVWMGALMLARYGLPGIAFLALYPWLRRRPDMVATPFGKINTVITSVALAGSSLLVLSGGPAEQADIAFGVLLAGTAVGHFVVLARRTLVDARSTAAT